MRLATVLSIILLALAVQFTGLVEAGDKYAVSRVYDGDTIAIKMDGNTEKVRLIGVNTPETHHPDFGAQCYGAEASRFTKQLLTGKQVKLVADPIGTNRDRYNRLLRYVYLPDGQMLNALLVKKGYGFAMMAFRFQYQASFAKLQSDAAINERGLWRSCDIYLKRGYFETQVLG